MAMFVVLPKTTPTGPPNPLTRHETFATKIFKVQIQAVYKHLLAILTINRVVSSHLKRP
jgi:hypothetical protein